MNWNVRGFEFDTRMPIYMGILNVTPDSFSDGGSYEQAAEALAHAHRMIEEGADIIDVGGESTRPGAQELNPEEELKRVLPVVRELAESGVCVSIDTRHAEVARACVEAGAAIINDVSGFRDAAMVELAAQTDVGCVVCHMQGDPRTMQQQPQYTDVVQEVCDYLKAQADVLIEAGMAANHICLDVGPGFGKTASQTRELLRNLHVISHLGFPLMVAVSRKSYIGEIYHVEEPSDRDDASAVEAFLACEVGGSVIRTHNVAKSIQALKALRPLVYLGLGCNVALTEPRAGLEGEALKAELDEAKKAQLNMALGNLCMLPDTLVVDVSSFYESEPAYFTDQDPFINMVVSMRTGVPPLELLEYLHAIEDQLGRVREQENGPRTCDIDILDYQLYVCESDKLTLPHPRLLERDFVVKPLLEIAPGHVLANGKVLAQDCISEDERVGAAKKL